MSTSALGTVKTVICEDDKPKFAAFRYQFKMLCKSKGLQKFFVHPTVAGGATANQVIVFNLCNNPDVLDTARERPNDNSRVQHYNNAAGVQKSLLKKTVVKFWKDRADAGTPKAMMTALADHIDRHRIPQTCVRERTQELQDDPQLGLENIHQRAGE